MAAERSDPHIPLKPTVFLALLALEESDRHGYGIKKEISRRTGGAIDLEPGTLYRLMARLLDRDLIQESEHRPAPDADDERRRYYRITPLGRRVLRAEAKRLTTLVDAADVRALVGEVEPQ